MTQITGTNDTNTRVAELIYPDLSYTIIGILFDVHNMLGNKCQEKHYQRAIAIKLKEANIPFEKEVKLNLSFQNEKLGTAFADFIIDNKITLETKMVWRISTGDVKLHGLTPVASFHLGFRGAEPRTVRLRGTGAWVRQVLRYLKSSRLRLGIIANFHHQRLELQRVAN